MTSKQIGQASDRALITAGDRAAIEAKIRQARYVLRGAGWAMTPAEQAAARQRIRELEAALRNG